ncbi:hypothetical protein II810_01035, partial [bacterium]|nr:hypothetical protein [bacterium]
MSREDIETNECLFWDINDLYKTNNQKPIGLIYKVLECFSHTLLDNEIFLSESDFQFNFAQQVKDFGATDVILEYPILTKCLYEKDTVHFENIRKAIIETYSKYKAECSDKSCPNYNNYKKNKQNEKCIKCYKLAKFNNDRTFIDLRFRYHDDEYFIEFKYKLSDTADLVCRYSESEQFKIKNQGAHNLGRPEIYEDIERMEHLKLLKDNACCFVVFITNDSQYWRLNGDENNK